MESLDKNSKQLVNSCGLLSLSIYLQALCHVYNIGNTRLVTVTIQATKDQAKITVDGCWEIYGKYRVAERLIKIAQRLAQTRNSGGAIHSYEIWGRGDKQYWNNERVQVLN